MVDSLLQYCSGFDIFWHTTFSYRPIGIVYGLWVYDITIRVPQAIHSPLQRLQPRNNLPINPTKPPLIVSYKWLYT